MRLYQPSPVLSSDPLYPPIPLSHRPFMLKRHWHTKTLTSSSAVHCYSTYSQAPYTPTRTPKQPCPEPQSKCQCNSNHSSAAPKPLTVTSASHIYLQRRQSAEERMDYWKRRMGGKREDNAAKRSLKRPFHSHGWQKESTEAANGTKFSMLAPNTSFSALVT